MSRLSTLELKRLSKIAIQARDNAYAPYSDHPVGVALVARSGKVYAGANVECANYKGICGEGAALAAMTTAGEREIRAVVIASPAMEYLCTPCGDCRQRLREFGKPDLPIYSLWKDGRLGQVLTLEQLLPWSFGPENMAEVGHGPLLKKTKIARKKKK
jgi:cytidine deaminase